MPKQPSPSQILAEFESTCGACSRKKTQGAPMTPCSGCRLVHYCNDECRERDRAKHSVECATLAVKGFRLMSSALSGKRGVDVQQWVEETKNGVLHFNVLPENLTAQQVEEWVARARVAFCHPSMHGEQTTYYMLLELWGRCVHHLEYETRNVEGYLSAVEELIARLPSSGHVWCEIALLSSLFMYCNVLYDVARAFQGVQLGRRMKPLVEEAARARDMPHALSFFLQLHATQLYHATEDIELDTPDGRATRLAMLGEAEAAICEALQLGHSFDSADAPAGFYMLLARFASAREAYDEALSFARRGMQVPSGYYSHLAVHAIRCLMELRRDVQAESLIIETLTKARRRSDLLTKAELGMVHYQHGILLCRQGDYNRAYTALDKAEFYIKQVDKANQAQVGLPLDEIYVQKVEVFEQMGNTAGVEGAERLMGAWAFHRPSSVVRAVCKILGEGKKLEAVKVLRIYRDDYENRGYAWQSRARWREGDALKPLELLRDQLEEGSEERAKVEALIERSTEEDEELKKQALEELQLEMREGRRAGAQAEGRCQAPIRRPRGSKASRKKRKKRERKRQQQYRSSEDGQKAEERGIGVDLSGLCLDDEEAPSDAGGKDHQQQQQQQQHEEEPQEVDECPMCFQPFDEDDQDDQQDEMEEVLGCGHRFHDVCIDRWLCKCKEKGLLPTCPMCRSKVRRGAGRSG